ncbi:hypothetical protein ACFS7Z_21185 [Pontibacter toksunensis]|uniref:AsmA-like protein n=1 Tax=Pontibacter toksunensis TaxID=1332631 RepID=A0ABW6BYK4_9BACT
MSVKLTAAPEFTLRLSKTNAGFMNKKAKWTILTVALLALLAGGLYFFLKKKYYPKVEDVAYIRLELAKDTAQVKAGIKVQNRIPLPIAIDSVHYTIVEDNTRLGWGQMTSAQTLPPLGDKVLDFRMMLDFEKYRQHLQEQQEKDSISLAVKTDVFFDLPLINPRSISLTRHLTVAVPKAPAMQLKDLVVRNFSVDSGYSFLLKVDATNRNLPDLTINNFQYTIQVGDTLTIAGQVDTTFHLQKGNKLLEIPLQLKTSDAIALINKVLSGDDKWNYEAHVEAQIESSHRLFDSFKLTVEKAGMLAMGQMGGSRASYLPSISRIKRLEIDSDEEQTLLQAELLVHNPAPIPFYIDSASYFIRHNGKIIASGKKDLETILQKSADQPLSLRLLVDESAYEQFMKNVQGQEKATLDVALNLVYNLPGAEKQSIRLKRQVQVPVQGQASIKVAGLEVRELSPQKGAALTLRLQVQSTNLPSLSIRNLDYTLQLGEDLTMTGHTQEPIGISSEDTIVEVPLHLSAEDVNQLINKALKGSMDWNYELQATAELMSSNDMIGSTKLNVAFTGELEMGKGMGGKQLVPQITSVDTLNVHVHYDTAWVKININVKNPLPVAFKVDSLLLTLSHAGDTFAISRESIGKVLPAEGTQSAWVTLAVNYGLWQEFLQQRQNQDQDSLELKETITLVYQVENLAEQRTTFQNTLKLQTPETPVAELTKVKLQGVSFTKGIVLQGLILVRNLNVEKLIVSDLTYDACVENLLDVCGTVNRTYHVPRGSNVVKVPLSLGVGEVFRALFAKLTGSGKPRNVFLNASATVTTNNPLLQDTFVRLEVWRKVPLFQKKQNKETEPQPRQAAMK